jgi:hypothetical protein
VKDRDSRLNSKENETGSRHGMEQKAKRKKSNQLMWLLYLSLMT